MSDNTTVVSAVSFVYILQHADEPIVKIGKSDRPLQRASQLPEQIDQSRSFVVEVDRRYATHVEKMLHFVASNFLVTRPQGDGYTEWFGADALSAVRAFIERGDLQLRLKPLATPPPPPRRTIAAARLRVRAQHAIYQPIANEGAVRAFIAAFTQELQTCAMFRSLSADDGTIYVRGKAMSRAMGDRIITLAQACDAPHVRWMQSVTLMDSEMRLRINLGYFSRVRFEYDPSAASELRAWFERIAELPATGVWRRRFDALEASLVEMLLNQHGAKRAPEDRPAATSVGAALGEV